MEFEEPNPTARKIQSHCRKLSSRFHPDRHRNTEEKERLEIEKKFVEIQQACGILNKVKINRERKNKWSLSGMENWDKHETMNNEHNDVDDYDFDDVDETDFPENQEFDIDEVETEFSDNSDDNTDSEQHVESYKANDNDDNENCSDEL